jgi:hypothetical protein
MFVCDAENCEFSGPNTTIKKGEITSVPYAVLSVPDGEKGKCPLCGAELTVVEDERHAFLRVQSRSIGNVADHMKRVIQRLTSSQYGPTEDDVEKVRAVISSLADQVESACDRRIERIKNPTARASKGKKAATPKFAL